MQDMKMEIEQAWRTIKGVLRMINAGEKFAG